MTVCYIQKNTKKNTKRDEKSNDVIHIVMWRNYLRSTMITHFPWSH